MEFHCNLFIGLIFGGAEYNVIVFIVVIYLLLFFGSCFAGVIGRLYKPLEVVFKGISLTIKLIVSFENLSSIAPFFMADFDRRRGVSMSTIWVFIPILLGSLLAGIAATLDAINYLPS